jgi:hypothetical protein
VVLGVGVAVSVLGTGGVVDDGAALVAEELVEGAALLLGALASDFPQADNSTGRVRAAAARPTNVRTRRRGPEGA